MAIRGSATEKPWGSVKVVGQVDEAVTMTDVGVVVEKVGQPDIGVRSRNVMIRASLGKVGWWSRKADLLHWVSAIRSRLRRGCPWPLRGHEYSDDDGDGQNHGRQTFDRLVEVDQRHSAHQGKEGNEERHPLAAVLA